MTTVDCVALAMDSSFRSRFRHPGEGRGPFLFTMDPGLRRNDDGGLCVISKGSGFRRDARDRNTTERALVALDTRARISSARAHHEPETHAA